MFNTCNILLKSLLSSFTHMVAAFALHLISYLPLIFSDLILSDLSLQWLSHTYTTFLHHFTGIILSIISSPTHSLISHPSFSPLISHPSFSPLTVCLYIFVFMHVSVRTYVQVMDVYWPLPLMWWSSLPMGPVLSEVRRPPSVYTHIVPINIVGVHRPCTIISFQLKLRFIS